MERSTAKTVARNALGIVTRMGHDLGHGGKAIEPGPEGKRPVPKALTKTKSTSKSHTIYAIKTVANATKTIAAYSKKREKVNYGYARVSTSEQETNLQIDALKTAGVTRIFQENCSGVGPRPRLREAIETLGAGDVLVVWKIDRIARSLGDLLSILAKLKRAGAAIRSLTEPIDTSSPIGVFTVQILGAVAELERSIIRERVMAGQAAAKARGKRWGAPRQIDTESERELVTMYLSGDYTIQELADIWNVGYGVARGAVLRVCNPRSAYLSRVRGLPIERR